MNLGDLVYGDFPTRYSSSMSLFPNGQELLAQGGTPEATQDGWFPSSIGQDAGRFAMKGPLPGRYYGPGWLAPNSGVVSVQSATYSGNGASDLPPAGTLSSPGALGPMTITTPMPSIMAPRSDQQTVPVPSCGIGEWVGKNPLLAIGVVGLVYLGFRGAK